MANDLINHGYVMNDLINHGYVIKTQKDGVQRASGLVNTWRCEESDVPREGMEDLRPFSIPCLIHLFHMAVLELYPLIINW